MPYVKCPPGYVRNPNTNRCRKDVPRDATGRILPVYVPCLDGYRRDPTTHRCRKITYSVPQSAEIAANEVIERQTNWQEQQAAQQAQQAQPRQKNMIPAHVARVARAKAARQRAQQYAQSQFGNLPVGEQIDPPEWSRGPLLRPRGPAPSKEVQRQRAAEWGQERLRSRMTTALPDDMEINPANDRPRKKCKVGYYRNPLSGRCKKIPQNLANPIPPNSIPPARRLSW